MRRWLSRRKGRSGSRTCGYRFFTRNLVLARKMTAISSPTQIMLLTTARAHKGGLRIDETWRLITDLLSELVERREAGESRGTLTPDEIDLVQFDGVFRVTIRTNSTQTQRGGALFTAPEVVTGQESTLATDVWLAARIAFWAAAPSVRPALGEYLRQALSLEPEQRPNPGALIAESAAAAAAGISVPDIEVETPDYSPIPTLHPQKSTAPHRAWIFRPHGSRISLWAILLLVGISLATYGSLTLFRPATGVIFASASLDKPEQSAPAQILKDLTATRDRAMSLGDETLLASVTIPGSAAAEADTALLESFRGSTPLGIRTQLRVGLTEEVEGRLAIEADLSQGGFRWHGGARDGVHVAPLPPRCAKFELEIYRGDWRVNQVRACAASSIAG